MAYLMTPTETDTLTGERADLLETLGKHRYFLRHTARRAWGRWPGSAGLREGNAATLGPHRCCAF